MNNYINILMTMFLSSGITPVDTGNMINSIRLTEDVENYIIVIDTDYASYTNDPPVKRKSNPNEGWVERVIDRANAIYEEGVLIYGAE